ncbi:MAG: flavodoxin domain-containing protein [Bacteroidales bacterium]
MKTVIIFSSKHGTTAKVAQMISDKIKENNDITLIHLDGKNGISLENYEKIILGTSVYAGKPSKKMCRFCEKNRSVLENKLIGLFVCGMYHKPDVMEEELKNAFPSYLHRVAKTAAFLGGEFRLEKMNFLERLIVKKVAKVTTSISKIDTEAVDKFSRIMK